MSSMLFNNLNEIDPSHAVIEGYVAHNEGVAEELAKIVITAYPATAEAQG